MQNDISTLKLDLKILGTSVVRANMLEKHQKVKKSQLKFLTKIMKLNIIQQISNKK